ncbi:MAG TPA: DUF4235 domain-containing protein [Nocardioidaceae bacterium]|nr:DUF4235 domain-containing protein [Nocardioidaceae bacterium]
MNVAKMLYRPFGLSSSILGGVVAGAVFKKVWARVQGEQEVPNPLRSQYGWRQMLLAAALQGAIYALVKATIDRAGAQAFERLTGEWPGD